MITHWAFLCIVAVGVEDWRIGETFKLAEPTALKQGSSELKCAIAVAGNDRINVGDALKLRIQFEQSGASSAIIFNPLFDSRTMQPGAIVVVNAEGKYVRELSITDRPLMQHIPKSRHWIELLPDSKVERTIAVYPSKEPKSLADLGSALGPGKYRAQLYCNDKLTSFRLPESTHKDFPLAQRLFNGPIMNPDVIRSNVIEFEIVAK